MADTLEPGDTYTTEDGRDILVQYTVTAEDGALTVYGRWIAEDGSIDALAAHTVTTT